MPGAPIPRLLIFRESGNQCNHLSPCRSYHQKHNIKLRAFGEHDRFATAGAVTEERRRTHVRTSQSDSDLKVRSVVVRDPGKNRKHIVEWNRAIMRRGAVRLNAPAGSRSAKSSTADRARSQKYTGIGICFLYMVSAVRSICISVSVPLFAMGCATLHVVSHAVNRFYRAKTCLRTTSNW